MATCRKLKSTTRKHRKQKKPPKPEQHFCPGPLVVQPHSAKGATTPSDANGNSVLGSEPARRFAQVHSEILGLAAYHRVCFGIMDPCGQSAQSGLTDDQFTVGLASVLDEFGQAMKPRDPLEKLALEQMLVHHARVLAMSKQASASSNPSIMKILNEGCDAAASSFRRLMTAFRDHRQPKNHGTSVSIANMAHQQIVEVKQNALEQTRIRAIEAGAAQALPPHGSGFEIAARRDQSPAPVGIEHRATNSSRKSQRVQKRAKARRTICRRDRASKAWSADD